MFGHFVPSAIYLTVMSTSTVAFFATSIHGPKPRLLDRPQSI
jgi:hypothetical protein